jgi:hypothetical protein
VKIVVFSLASSENYLCKLIYTGGMLTKTAVVKRVLELANWVKK